MGKKYIILTELNLKSHVKIDKLYVYYMYKHTYENKWLLRKIKIQKVNLSRVKNIERKKLSNNIKNKWIVCKNHK